MTPPWVLALAFWLHMLATVAWIGGLTALALIVLPAAHRSLEVEDYAALLEAIQRRLDPLAWFCLALLAATGMLQMSASPNYLGFLAISNVWAGAILVKHLIFLVMALLSAYQTWGLLPALRRAVMLAKRGGEAGQQVKIQQRELLLMRLNLVLGVIALALTAVARAVS
jgi:uncharacterized membrane protein